MNDSLGTNEQILERLKSFSKPDDYPFEYFKAVVAHLPAMPDSNGDPTIREIFFLIKHFYETACNDYGARAGLPEGGLALLIDAANREGDQEMRATRRAEIHKSVEEALAEFEADGDGDRGSGGPERMKRLHQKLHEIGASSKLESQLDDRKQFASKNSAKLVTSQRSR